jgi:hypothetical protein
VQVTEHFLCREARPFGTKALLGHGNLVGRKPVRHITENSPLPVANLDNVGTLSNSTRLFVIDNDSYHNQVSLPAIFPQSSSVLLAKRRQHKQLFRVFRVFRGLPLPLLQIRLRFSGKSFGAA